ncbi:MAG: hypothetical protein WCO00_01330 [Rhodospirillaceae bacterium]
MSWIDTLDRLITDSWMASRDESAAMLDSLLALSLAERWELFASRDSRLMFLSDEDYAVLFRSLNAHSMFAQIGDAAAPPVTEEATEVLPEDAERYGEDGAEAGEGEMADDQGEAAVAEAVAARRSWWRTRKGLRWLGVAIALGSALMLVGAFLAVIVLYLLPGTRVEPRSADTPGTLITKLDEVERDQAQLAKRLVGIDNRVSDLATSVDQKFGTAMRAVRFSSALDQLQAAIERGAAYKTELDRVAPVVAAASDLAALVKRLDGTSATGVPSLAALRERFDEIAPRLGGVVDIRDQFAPQLVEVTRDQNILARAFGWVGSVFGLTETPETRRFRAALGGIRAALGLGNLPVAVRQFEDLHAYPGELAGRWLATAHSRLDADAAMAALRQGALSSPAVSRDQ